MTGPSARASMRVASGICIGGGLGGLMGLLRVPSGWAYGLFAVIFGAGFVMCVAAWAARRRP